MNFLLAAHVRGDRHPQGFDSKRSQLIAPSVGADRWMKMLWTDKATGRKWHITTSDAGLADFVRVSSYRDIVAEFATHPEPKSAGPDGEECDRMSAGLQNRRTIDARSVVYIGKESNRLEDVEQGLVHSLDDVQGTYVDAETEWREVLRPFARSMPMGDLCKLLKIGERQARNVRTQKTPPSQKVRSSIRTAFERGGAHPGSLR